MTETPSDPQYAEAWLTGTPPDQTTAFYIPRGNTGPPGPRGPIGPTPLVGKVETNMGPAAEGTVGATGLTGPKGDPGGWVDAALIASTLDINNLTTPGVYRTSGVADPTFAKNYPVEGRHMFITVYAITASTVILQQEAHLGSTLDHGRVLYRRVMISGVWYPWRAFNATRVDQTAGRAVYQWDNVNNRDQLIYGDTGWRKVILPGEIANHPNLNGFIRRVDNEVEFTIYETTSGALASGNQNIYVVPTGFKFVLGESPAMLSGMVIDSSASPVANSVMYIASAGTNTVVLKAIVNVRHYSSLRWKTQEPWPTTLPGTAHGSIPNL